MSIEAMKQALEALEAIRSEKHIEAAQIIAKNARYSLRQAIEQAEQWDTSDMAYRPNGLTIDVTDLIQRAIAAEREACAKLCEEFQFDYARAIRGRTE